MNPLPTLFALAVATGSVAAGTPPIDLSAWAALLPDRPPADPADAWSLDFQTAILWRASNNTSVDYVVAPQIVSLRTPEHFRLELGGGSEITLRARFSLIAEPVIEGPESAYFAFAFSPSLEYWNAAKTRCLFVGAGGGAGTIDSRGEPGGQGQDFTLNWFAEAGIRWYLRPDLAVSAGAYFQHLSNGGQTDPNPGLDAVGPVLGLTWHF